MLVSTGYAHFFGEGAQVRRVLYMDTISAIRWNTVIQHFYEWLTTAGKPAKVALVACMRKLLIIPQCHGTNG